MGNVPQQQLISQLSTMAQSNGQPIIVQLLPPVEKKKTSWDWIQLFMSLALPLALTLIGTFATIYFNATEQMIAKENRDADHQIADNQQQEAILRAYLDDMSNLLVSTSVTTQLHQATKSDEIRKVAQAKTLVALENLQGARKGFVILFLYKADLITWHNLSSTPAPNEDTYPLVPLDSADLSGADLSGIFMDNADIHNTNLEKADFSGSILSYDNLSFTDLRGATLKNTFLHGVDLHGSNLRGADLSGAFLNCQAPAVPTTAFDRDKLLTCPNLDGIILDNANLSGANLAGVTLTKDQISKASHCKNTIMPDGQKHLQDSCIN